jgi:hypothetical protein
MVTVLQVLFLACLPVGLILLLTGRPLAGALVFLVGTPVFWAARNMAMRQTSSQTGPTSPGVLMGVGTVMGRWEGTVRAMHEGFVITGTRTWFEWRDPDDTSAGHTEHHEPSSFKLPWDSMTAAAVLANGTLLVRTRIGVHLELQGFERRPDEWLALLEAHGVHVDETTA